MKRKGKRYYQSKRSNDLPEKAQLAVKARCQKLERHCNIPVF